MRTILGPPSGAIGLALLSLASCASAWADNNYYQTTAQFGMTLPQATLPSGQDEIRTADGTSCRSAVGGNGAYFDMGVIGAPGDETINASTAGYGRIVIPLGSQAKRLDCTKLYEMELARLKMELELARMGASGGVTAPASGGGWDDEGWSNGPAAATALKPAGTEVVVPLEQDASQAQARPKPAAKLAAKAKPAAAVPVQAAEPAVADTTSSIAAAPAMAVRPAQPAKLIPASMAEVQPATAPAKPERKRKKSLLGVFFPAPVIVPEQTAQSLY